MTTLELVGRIVARYRGHRRSIRSVPRVLQQLASTSTHVHRHVERSTWITHRSTSSPRVTVRLCVRPLRRGRGPSTPAPASTTVVREHVPRSDSPAQSLEPVRTAPAVVRGAIQRVTPHRSVRAHVIVPVSSRVRARPIPDRSVVPSATRPTAACPAPPMVVRRSGPERSTSPRPERAPSSSPGVVEHRRPPPRPAAAVPEPTRVSEAELGRLTDRVVQQINRRVIAQRERMGGR